MRKLNKIAKMRPMIPSDAAPITDVLLELDRTDTVPFIFCLAHVALLARLARRAIERRRPSIGRSVYEH
jgi:hypothetical protein